MRIALVQCYSQNNFSYYFMTEHIRLFYAALCDLGCDVIFLNNQYDPSRFNIFFSSVSSEPDLIKDILTNKIDFAVYQPEILTSRGVNYRKEGDRIMSANGIGGLYQYLNFIANARIVLEIFPFNQRYLAEYKIKSILFPLGHHQTLENTPESNKDFDLCFFGLGSSYRKRIISELEEAGLNCEFVIKRHNFFRDNVLTRTKINLALPYNTNSMSHISPFRVYTGLYNGCMTLSVNCKTTPSVDGLLEYVPENQLIDRIQELLKNDLYATQYAQFKKRHQKRSMKAIMKQLLLQIKSSLKKDTYAGEEYINNGFENFTPISSDHISFE